MFNIMFDDSSWKYTFLILMIIIFVGCGIYTFIKIYLQQKKEENETIKNNDKELNEYTKAVLDNEDIIIKRKDEE